MMRMEWINEGRPRSSVHEDSIFDEPSLPPREGGEREKTAPRIAPIFEKRASERPTTPVREDGAEMEMDDLYDATPRASRQTRGIDDSQPSLFGDATNTSGPVSGTGANDAPPEDDLDDLDALLAEEEMMQDEVNKAKPTSTTSKPPATNDDPFEDDMEAMAEMDGLW